MDFLRAGEALCRSSQPVLAFLAPSASRPRRVPISSRLCNHRLPRPSQAFTTSPRHQQQNAAARKEDDQQPTTSSTTDDFSALLDSALSSDKGVPTAPQGRTSRFASPQAQPYNSPSRLTARAQQERSDEPALRNHNQNQKPQKPRGAMDELLDFMDEPQQSRQSRTTTMPSTRMPGASSSPSNYSADDSLDIERMLNPLGNQRSPHLSSPPPAPPQIAPMKLNSSTGRTVVVDTNRGMDAARAFRALEIQCARNSVRRDFMRQRFHERPGLKRKRLKSERWRRRFKEGFKKTVGLVQRLRGQGW